ncbi:MAG: ATP-binding cassette domain-containing protein [Bacteriovoracaceae bacterium]
MEHAIVCKNLTKYFGTQKVLSELNFNIDRGKITTILGFSGAGKSTLLKHILGLEHPTSGEIIVLGQNLQHIQKLDLREFRRKFGMLFQYAALFDSLTAIENVAFPLKEFTSLSKAEIKEKAEALFTSVGLEAKSFHRYPSELSGGMRKRVGLARALALDPEILLYDEPTTGLDPITTKMVNELIISTAERLKSRAVTSVIISHDIRATLKISDYVAFLDQGKIVEHLSVKDFKESKNEKIRSFIDL